MDLVQIRQEILKRNVTPMEKARTLLAEKAVWKLSKSQWDFFTFPLPKEVEDAIAFLEMPPSKCRLRSSVTACILPLESCRNLCSGEQQRQMEALEARLNKYIEDKFAEKRLGIYILHPAGKHRSPRIDFDSVLALRSGHSKTQ